MWPIEQRKKLDVLQLLLRDCFWVNFGLEFSSSDSKNRIERIEKYAKLLTEGDSFFNFISSEAVKEIGPPPL